MKYDLSEYFYSKNDETKASALIQLNYEHETDEDSLKKWERLTNFILEPMSNKSLLELIDKNDYMKNERTKNIPFKFVKKKDIFKGISNELPKSHHHSYNVTRRKMTSSKRERDYHISTANANHMSI